MQVHIEAGTSKETILSSFPMLLSGVAYIERIGGICMDVRQILLSQLGQKGLVVQDLAGR